MVKIAVANANRYEFVIVQEVFERGQGGDIFGVVVRQIALFQIGAGVG